MPKPTLELLPELKPVAKALARDRHVVRFKSTSLCYDDRVFAMIVKGALVMKDNYFCRSRTTTFAGVPSRRRV